MHSADSFNLQRFLDAQEHVYARALAEIRAGRKETHWMWFIFPQLDGLGFSPMAERYAITNLDEARAYLAHPTLNTRLIEVAEAALSVNSSSARAVFGTPDDLKLRSCATLFAEASPPGSVFERLLEKYYRGEKDEKTLRLLKFASE
ncbi:DUF1810 domain-containing protein [Lacipirellula parvula]|uniref:NTP pyrophosphohydrolase n=1 Tax=Lacipirellula parvula TaxID=2650471 RepID=A0A5K7XJX8_9BACT|nr:DUF1810 domain-containing protein [Lacipirellula parvula]BBO34553.1 hypothetical protein PLANPX_4165 [Lacipirellula parvula]